MIEENDKASRQEILIYAAAAVLIAALMALAVVRLGVGAPKSGFFTGQSLPLETARVVLELGLVADTADIAYFYSDALFDIRERMVIATDSGLIVYVKEDSPPVDRMLYKDMESTGARRDFNITGLTSYEFTDDVYRSIEVRLPDKDAGRTILEHVNRRRLEITRITQSPIETLGPAEVHERLDAIVRSGVNYFVYSRHDTSAGHVEFRLEKRPVGNGRTYYVYTERYLFDFADQAVDPFRHAGWTENYYDVNTLKMVLCRNRNADLSRGVAVALTIEQVAGDTYAVHVNEYRASGGQFKPAAARAAVWMNLPEEYLYNQIEEHSFTAALHFEQMLSGKRVRSSRLYPSPTDPYYRMIRFEDRLDEMEDKSGGESDTLYSLVRRRDGDAISYITLDRSGMTRSGTIWSGFLNFKLIDRNQIPAAQLKRRLSLERRLTELPDP